MRNSHLCLFSRGYDIWGYAALVFQFNPCHKEAFDGLPYLHDCLVGVFSILVYLGRERDRMDLLGNSGNWPVIYYCQSVAR